MGESAQGGSRANISKPERGKRALALAASGTVFLALVIVDPAAQASFDAPKRLVTMIGLAVVSAIAAMTVRVPLARTGAARISAAALASGVLLVFASAALSPHRAVAAFALAPVVLFGALFVAGCAPVLSRAVWVAVRNGFVAGAVVNAVLSLLQVAGLVRLFAYASLGGRRNVSALIGNDAILGLVLALAAVAVAPRARDRASRATALAALAVLLAGLAASRSFIAWGITAAGLLVVFAGDLRRHSVRAAVAISAGLIVAVAGLAPRTAQLREAVRAGNFDIVLSFRLAPWTSALMMVRDRPLAGLGPASFPLEFTVHRIEADAVFGRRFVSPFEGSYAQAHSDVLQAAAELGLPSALLLIAGVGVVLVTLVRKRSAGGECLEVAGMLAAVAVAALAWFPMHHPPMAMLAVAAAARGWALVAGEEET